MKKKATALLMALLTVFSILPLSGCGDGDDVDNTPNYPVEVGGVKFVGAPSKVVCYSSTLIGIIYAMGYEKQLFGRTANCDYKEADDLKACGTPDNPSVDLLFGNNVDLVIADDTIAAKSVKSIQEKGIPVVVIPRATGRASMVEMYGALGACFKGGNTGYNKGCQIANDLFAQLDDISRLVETEAPWNTCVILSSDLTEFATGDTLVSAVLELTGGFNVARDSMQGEYALSDLMRSDPDVIISKEIPVNDVVPEEPLEPFDGESNVGQPPTGSNVSVTPAPRVSNIPLPTGSNVKVPRVKEGDPYPDAFDNKNDYKEIEKEVPEAPVATPEEPKPQTPAGGVPPRKKASTDPTSSNRGIAVPPPPSCRPLPRVPSRDSAPTVSTAPSTAPWPAPRTLLSTIRSWLRPATLPPLPSCSKSTRAAATRLLPTRLCLK